MQHTFNLLNQLSKAAKFFNIVKWKYDVKFLMLEKIYIKNKTTINHDSRIKIK